MSLLVQLHACRFAGLVVGVGYHAKLKQGGTAALECGWMGTYLQTGSINADRCGNNRACVAQLAACTSERMLCKYSSSLVQWDRWLSRAATLELAADVETRHPANNNDSVASITILRQ